MKKLTVLLILLGLSLMCNSQVQYNYLIVDSVNVIPVADTATVFNNYPATARKTGAVIMQKSNRKLYYFKGLYWVEILTAGGAAQTNEINSWIDIPTTTKQTVWGEGYIATSTGATTLDFTLPITANIGDVFAVSGRGIAGWRVFPNGGQIIHVSGNTTTPAGYVHSGTRYDVVYIRCIAPNEFSATIVVGSLSVF